MEKSKTAFLEAMSTFPKPYLGVPNIVLVSDFDHSKKMIFNPKSNHKGWVGCCGTGGWSVVGGEG